MPAAERPAAERTAAERTVVDVEGRRVSLSHLERVLYPRTGTTKAAVLHYYTQVAPFLLPHLAGRPASFLRCPTGVDGERFWAKNVPAGAPDWVRVLDVEVRTATLRQVVVQDLPTLVWAGNLACLEIHTPQWREAPDLHDRLIIDLDPGEGTSMTDTCAAALAVREVLAEDGIAAWPKTSGSKGVHLVAPLRPSPAEAVSRYAKRLAGRLRERYPGLVIDRMNRDARHGLIFLDWSQNTGMKTTVAPYSLRALAEPTVSTPVGWEELADCRDPEGLRFTPEQVVARVAERGDLMAPLLDPSGREELPGVPG
ncbi:non-homologous end-joining DNA ligase [Streptacidiphilus cavernicola]|uniref:Non-homologous end-joining DNA ligase n=1 Tax=Streptacidiphilus cavernicola TaxID=3342716 RepID=A0ABV6VPS6_9ACTN